MAAMTFTSPNALLRIERIQHLLRQFPMTEQEVAIELYFSQRWARSYLTYLHSESKIYISKYKETKNLQKITMVKVYSWGQGKDVKKQYRLDPATRARTKRKELIKDIDAHDLSLAKRRAKNIIPQIDWTTFWIPRRAAA